MWTNCYIESCVVCVVQVSLKSPDVRFHTVMCVKYCYNQISTLSIFISFL